MGMLCWDAHFGDYGFEQLIIM